MNFDWNPENYNQALLSLKIELKQKYRPLDWFEKIDLDLKIIRQPTVDHYQYSGYVLSVLGRCFGVRQIHPFFRYTYFRIVS